MLAQTRSCDANHLQQCGKRRAWTRQRTVPVAEPSYVPEAAGWPQPTKPIVTCCAANQGRSGTSFQLSRAAKTLAKNLVPLREPHEWLQAASSLSSQDVLKVACELQRQAAGQSLESAGQDSAASNSLQLVMARQLLLLLEQRDLHDLPGNMHTLSALCQVLLDLNQFTAGKAKGALQQAEAVATAGLRWQRLLAWVCRQVVSSPQPLNHHASSVILQCLASAAYPAHHQVLLVLIQGLLSRMPDTHAENSRETQQVYARKGSKTAGSITSGLQAAASLRPLLGEQDAAQVQACLEDSALQLAPHISTMCPVAVQALCVACHQYHCIIPPETVGAVMQAAAARCASGKTGAATATCLALAAALVSPFMCSAPQSARSAHDQLIDGLLGSTTSSTGVHAAADAYLQGLHLVDSTDTGSVVAAVLSSGNPGLMARTLQVVAGSQTATESSQALLEALASQVRQLSTTSLCQACAAVGHLRLHDTTHGQVLVAECTTRLSHLASTGMSAAAGSELQVPAADCVAHLAAAFRWQLTHSSTASQPPLVLTALQALALAQQQHTTTLQHAAAHQRLRQAYEQLGVSLCEACSQQGGMCGQPGWQESCMAALYGLTSYTPWMLPEQRLSLLQAYSQLNTAPGLNGTTRGTHVQGLLHAISLSIWANLDHMSDAHICDTMYEFGRLGWQPGLLIRAMVQAVSRSVTELPPGTYLPLSADSNQPGGLSVQHVVRFSWGLARLSASTSAARALTCQCVSAVLRTHTASMHNTLTTSTDSPLASSWDSSSRVVAARDAAAESAQQEAVSQPVSLDDLCSLLWSYAELGAVGAQSLEMVRELMLAIMGHPDTCNLRQLGLLWRSAGQLGLSGSRLTTWLATNTTQRIQAALHAATPQQADDSNTGRSGGSQATTEPQDSCISGWVLSQICSGMQLLGHKPNRQLCDLLVDAALSQSVTMRPAHLVAVVYMLAQTGHAYAPQNMPPLYKLHNSSRNGSGGGAGAADQAGLPWARLLHVAAQRLHDDVAAFTIPQSIYLSWVLAKSGQHLAHTTLQTIAQQLLDCPPCKVFPSRAARSQHVQPHLHRGMQRVTDELVSQFIWACSVCAWQPTQLLSTYASALPHRLTRHYLDQDALQAAGVVSAAVFGLGSCQYRPSEALRQTLITGMVRYHQFFTSHQLSSGLYGLAQMGIDPGAAWQQGLVHQLIKVAKQMSLQELTHTLWALAQWPVKESIGQSLYQEVQAALRPVLLVHVLGAQVQAAAAYDAAGEPTLPTTPHATDANTSSPSQPLSTTPTMSAATTTNASSTGPVGEDAAGIAFGRVPSQADMAARAAVIASRPPLSAASLTNLAVGAVTLEVSTPDVAEAIAGWALSEAAGGLARFSSRQLCCLLWAMARCKHDRLSLFEGAGEVLVSRIMSGVPAATNSASSTARGSTTERQLCSSDLQRLLWAWAKFNRHPGEELLEAIRVAWLHATDTNNPALTQQQQQQQPGSQVMSSNSAGGAGSSSVGAPIEEVSGMMYSLAILREHNHPLMVLLSQQLGAAHRQLLQSWPTAAATTQLPTSAAQPQDDTPQPAEEVAAQPAAAAPGTGGGVSVMHPRLMRQAPQLAACMLAAQAERQQSPLVVILTPAQRAKVIDAWRTKVAAQAAKPAGYKRDLMNMAYKMGLMCRAELSPDGLCSPDLTITLPFAPSLRFTLELVGSHNTAANSGRLLGDAAVKYRLLQARGYLVVPVSCKEWDKLGAYDTLSKTLYLQSKLDKRLAALTSSAGPQLESGAPLMRPEAGPAQQGTSSGVSDQVKPAGEPPAVDVTVRAVPSRIEMAPPRAPDVPFLTAYKGTGSAADNSSSNSAHN